MSGVGLLSSMVILVVGGLGCVSVVALVGVAVYLVLENKRGQHE